jgi:hypothetical protein
MPSKKRIVLSNKFQRIGDIGLATRRRVTLSKTLAAFDATLLRKHGVSSARDLRFIIYANAAGQILLSPQVIHPEEAWLYKTPKALTSVRRGLKQLAGGKRYNLGSFAQYADDEID